MLMGPGADGSILVDGMNHRVYPFTEVQQQGRHRADDDTRAARLLSEALRSNPVPCRSTVVAQVATMDISADEYERARSVPVMDINADEYEREEDHGTPYVATMDIHLLHTLCQH